MNQPFLGFHYDIGRGAYLRPEIFCQAIELAAQSGYTHFLPYLENMIRLPSMERACPQAAYTTADWKVFQKTAVNSGIELVPHFNAIGHCELFEHAYPELGGKSSIGRMEMDPSLPAAKKWVRSALEEFCAISQSDYFLIGGDEWQPPQYLLAQPGFDPATAWVDQMNMAVETVVAHGRTPIVWHDIPLHYTTALARLSRRAVLAYWFYDFDSDYPVLEMFKKMGFRTLMASGLHSGRIPRLSRRVVEALRAAASAAKRHQADGLLVTTWEGARWESQCANIPLAARVLRGEEPPHAIVEAMTRLDTWSKLPRGHTMAERLASEALDLLKSPEFDAFPDLRDMSLAQLREDKAADKESYLKFHYAEGPVFKHVEEGWTRPEWPQRPLPSSEKMGATAFGLRVEENPEMGAILRFENGREHFEIYPYFGASLQNWHRDGMNLLCGGISRLSKTTTHPGGYRSFAAAGGLRPIWALGTHSNPSITSQYPYDWKMIEQTSERVMVELWRSLPQVDIRLRVEIKRGESGFHYEARGINRLENAWSAFNFSLPVTFYKEDVEKVRFSWNEGRQLRETSISGEVQSAFWIPAAGNLRLVIPDVCAIQIEADSSQTAGYFVDWASGCITPDLHGVYRPRRVGEEVIARWRFSAGKTS